VHEAVICPLFVCPLFIPKFCSWRVRLRVVGALDWSIQRRWVSESPPALFAPDSIHLYDHIHALLPIGIERSHVFAMQERD
jgi:hypothetical protein